MKIYLVAGKSGSGKGEVAKIIEDYYTSNGKKAIITEYSKYIKMFAKEIINWDGNNPKPRKFLQDTGIIIREELNLPDFFVNRMIEDIKVYNLYCDAVIIADVRFPDEIEKLKRSYDNVISIRIQNGFSNSKLSVEEQKHISENALNEYNNFDATIVNDDINNLKEKVIKILESSEL